MRNRQLYFAIALACPLFAIPAIVHGQTTDAQSNPRSVSVRHACSKALGLDPQDVAYDDCVRSLKQSLESQISASNTARAREATACADVGLKPGTPAFDQCVLNLDESETDAQDDASR